MKAAILKSFGHPLVVEDAPDPVPGTGEVVVDVVATPVLPYAAEVFSGARRYPLDLPVIPGCGAVGRVRTVGPDATRLQPGDWVFCDPTVRSRDDALMPDITLQGWSARGEGGLKLQRYFRDGPLAQQMRVPTENAVPIGAIGPAEAGRWCALNTLLISYGGLLAMDLKAGETLLVSGATGNFGSATVQVALAMGARRVVAPGRNEAVLQDLARRFGDRVAPVRLSGDEARDGAAMAQAAGGPIDAVIDFLPPAVPARVVRTAVMCVRPYGRAVLMGGVGMLGGEDLALPYPWIMRNNVTIRGQWMYPREAVTRMVGLVRSGLLDLAQHEVTAFPLDAVEAAVRHAADHAAPFRLTVVTP
ncbi:MAG: zinc-binding alcohol dehydrogenase family protein [Caulobacteraceae bacterium]|nr:zinc-binding alcohol dehydrogenase family protein [Caulobacter sp.]